MKKRTLKRKLKSIYKQIIFGFEDYNCGHKLLCTVSSEYLNLCIKFNKVADKLSKLDSDCPKHRWVIG
jgi:hypothetical protein